MRKKNILKIHLLGEFYMENKNYRFPAGNKEEYTADPFDRLSDDVSAYGGIQGKAD